MALGLTQLLTDMSTRNKLNGIYLVYRHKHNTILCSIFTITKAQLHVSAINVGHLQDVQEELINKLYQRVCGVTYQNVTHF